MFHFILTILLFALNRHVSKGGWPFSTSAHGWPISDCTAEGLKGVLSLHKVLSKYPDTLKSSYLISKERLQEAVNVILTLHNADGGWATYENNRFEFCIKRIKLFY